MKIKSILTFSLILVVLLLAACNSNSSSGKNESITVYTSVPQNLIDQFQAAFIETYPDIEVNVYRAGTGDILSKLRTEKEANSVAADVVWVADFVSAEALKEMDMLAKYESKEASAINENLIDPDGYYYGSRIINMVLAYNTKIEAPNSWNDMLDSKYAGKIGIPSVSSGTSFSFVGTLAASDRFGWDYFEKMRENGGIQLTANKDAAEKVATGELEMAVVLDYMVKEMKDQGSPIDYIVPEEGLVMVASPIALLADSSNPEGAKTFIDFTISKEGQKIMAEQNVVSVREDVEPPEGVPSINDLKIFPTDVDYLETKRSEIIERFEQIFTN